MLPPELDEEDELDELLLDEDDDDDLDDNFLARLDGNAADVRSPVNLFLD